MTEISTPGAAESPSSKLDKILGYVPRALASHAHIVFLLGLLCYLVVLPVLKIYTPGSTQMLIGGNWTNVTSDMGACIAAGGTLTVLKHSRQRAKVTAATHQIIADLYREHSGQHHPAAIAEIISPQE